jgi:pyochelin synthetase
VHEAVREAREAALALLAGRPATVGPARASLPAGTAGTAATATAATATAATATAATATAATAGIGR